VCVVAIESVPLSCAELLADALQVAHLAHDHLDALEHVFTWLGDALEALAVAREDVHAQLIFQFQDGLGNARLRGVQRLGRFGQIELAPHRLLDEAELVKVHNLKRIKTAFIMPSKDPRM